MEGIDNSTTSLQDFINSSLNQIQSALPNSAEISGEIKFEISVVSQREKDGGINLRVVNYDSGISQQETQKIIFNVRFPTEHERLENEIAILKEQQKIKSLKEPVRFPVAGVRRADSEPGYLPGF